jgi:bacteriocin-like protein
MNKQKIGNESAKKLTVEDLKQVIGGTSHIHPLIVEDVKGNKASQA